MQRRHGVTSPALLVMAGVFGMMSRVAALQVPAQTRGNDYSQVDIAYGERLYSAQCNTCHGPTGDGVAGVDFRSGKFRNGTTDQDLVRIIANGIPGTGMLGFRLDPPELTGIVAYLRNINTFDRGTAKLGDEGRGRTVFEQKDCMRCHRVGAQGSRVAPDLSDIGALRGAGSLERSLLDPTSQMMPINRPVRIVTGDGTVITGRRLNEDTYTLQLIDDRERLMSLDKATLREFTILTTSPMPAYKGVLSSDELADLLAFLLSLKGR
jgi:putative heme-binding domain-containing protein